MISIFTPVLNNQQQYDYIIAGAGAAGLSLLMRMLNNAYFQDKKILLIDKDRFKTNDRTWCYWEQEQGFFEQIVFRQWSHLDFFGEDHEAELNILPYRYKMIRGEDFYAHCFAEITKHPQVSRLFGEIRDIRIQDGRPFLMVDNEVLDTAGAIVFNSVYTEPRARKKDMILLQHFKGWVIETETPSFATNKATLMDFRVPQDHGTSFAYVLPFDPHTALVEYTLFTPSLLNREQYDLELHNYISKQLQVRSYRVKEQEFGVIPMTNLSFPFYKNGVYHIGAAGGQTKASTGYTFRFIQKQSDEIIDRLVSGQSLVKITPTPRRFRFYDHTLLHILYHNRLPGKKIFSELFRKNDPVRVLKFLDNESSLADELKIISSLPTWPFLKAAISSV